MKHRKKIKIIWFISVLGFILALFLTTPSSFGLCPQIDKFCLDPYDEILGQPLGLFSIVIFFLPFSFFFLHESIFRSWAKFAKIYLPIAAILILGSAFSNQGGGWGVGADFDSELTTWWLAGIFLFVSLIIIAVKSWKLRKDKITI
ncbi:MAG: hypothetical protein AAB885_00450 [Patescibacteria group bacterium]